tara:strand:- start:835 stop:1800 length:966 start_codon:yes stop_codon:yes gene_type:complete
MSKRQKVMAEILSFLRVTEDSNDSNDFNDSRMWRSSHRSLLKAEVRTLLEDQMFRNEIAKERLKKVKLDSMELAAALHHNNHKNAFYKSKKLLVSIEGQDPNVQAQIKGNFLPHIILQVQDKRINRSFNQPEQYKFRPVLVPLPAWASRLVEFPQGIFAAQSSSQQKSLIYEGDRVYVDLASFIKDRVLKRHLIPKELEDRLINGFMDDDPRFVVTNANRMSPGARVKKYGDVLLHEIRKVKSGKNQGEEDIIDKLRRLFDSLMNEDAGQILEKLSKNPSPAAAKKSSPSNLPKGSPKGSVAQSPSPAAAKSSRNNKKSSA